MGVGVLFGLANGVYFGLKVVLGQTIIAGAITTIALVLLFTGAAIFAVANESPQHIIQEASDEVEDSKWDAALELVDRAVDKDPEYAEARLVRGIVYFQRGDEGDIQLALQAFEKAVEVEPDCAPAYN